MTIPLRSLSVTLWWLRRRLSRVRDAAARRGGGLLLRLGRPGAATGLLRGMRASDVRRSLAARELRRGVALLRAGDHDRAEEPLRTATLLAPLDPHAHRRLANCLTALRRWDEAAALLRRSRDRFHGEPAFAAQLGVVLVELGAPEEAAGVLATVADLPDGDPRWLRWYATALVKAGAREEALAAAERLAGRAPDDPKALQTVGLIFLEYGVAEQAARYLRAATDIEASVERSTALARALLAAGSPNQALEAAREAVSRAPDQYVAHAALAEVLLALDRVEEAREVVRTALRSHPDEGRLHVLLAQTHDATGDFQESHDQLLRYVSERPSDPQALKVAAGYFAEVGDIVLACELAARLVELAPGTESFVLQADYLQRSKKSDAAVAALRRAIALDPAAAGAMATMATVLAREHRIPEAIEQLEAALALRPDQTKWRRKVASLLLDLKLVDRAEAHLRVLLARYPDDPTGREQIARALLLAGRTDEAEHYVNHAAAEPLPAFVAFRHYLEAGEHKRAFAYLADRHRVILEDVAASRAAP